MEQAQVTERSVGADAHEMDVRYVAGESYEVSVRGHRVLVDQPADAGGLDTAPTPTELFVASLATCVAFYAGRYLTRHGYDRDGLAVSAGFEMASDRPARVSRILSNSFGFGGQNSSLVLRQSADRGAPA